MSATCFPLNPQWVSICIGINDVWRQFDSPALTDQAVDPVEYEENLRTMIEQAKNGCEGRYRLHAVLHGAEQERLYACQNAGICGHLRAPCRRIRLPFCELPAVYDKFFAV